jgi:hypothetical protein
MTGYIWNANPAKWNVVPPAMDSWDALKTYIIDPSAYVYWSTPVLQGQIKLGDDAFIWRTKYRSMTTVLSRLAGAKSQMRAPLF